MNSAERVLVVGATGRLGRKIARRLVEAGCSVRALLRPSAQLPDEIERLPIDRVPGDLADPTSLIAACDGVASVISTATALPGRRTEDNVEAIDERGHLALLEAAERSRATRFVYLSFPVLTSPAVPSLDFTLQRAKRVVEKRLASSTLDGIVIQSAHFMEVWLEAGVGFNPLKGQVTVPGSGEQKLSYVSLMDVAAVALAALRGEARRGEVISVGGPEAVSPLAVARIFESLGAPPCVITPVGEEVFVRRLAEARRAGDGLAEARAAFGLATAAGLVVTPRRVLELTGERLLTVRDFAKLKLNPP